MNRGLLCGIVVVFFVLAVAVGLSGTVNASADYSNMISVTEVQSITGFNQITLKSMDSKKSGEANDLAFSTAGKLFLGIQVLKGSDYDRYYEEFRCQDYRPMPYAFWGPKTATPENPPDQLWFRKGDMLILIASYHDSQNKPFLTVEMMENIAAKIAPRI